MKVTAEKLIKCDKCGVTFQIRDDERHFCDFCDEEKREIRKSIVIEEVKE